MEPSDSELIRQVRRGQTNVFRLLVERYWQKIHVLIRRSVQDAGYQEDLCQETFFRAFEKLNQFDLDRPFGPWIGKICLNLIFEHFRSVQKGGPLLPLAEDVLRSEAIAPDQEALQRMTFEEWLDHLPLKIRLVFCLRHGVMLSLDEIAEVLEEPVGTVKATLFKARQILKTRLEKG